MNKKQQEELVDAVNQILGQLVYNGWIDKSEEDYVLKWARKKGILPEIEEVKQ